MADLENLLLEAAGRTNTGVRNRHSIPPSRRRREGSYSDGGSDDSDDDRGYGSRKPSGSQVPLKKRLEATDRDDGHGSQGEVDYDGGHSDHEGDSSDESDVGDDLYKNEDDRQKLAQLTELEREMILSERADKRGDKKFTEKIRSKRDNEKNSRSRKETPPLPSSRGVRSSARSADRATAKDDALNELRAKRLKQQDPEAHRKLGDAPRGSSGGRGFSPIKQKSASLSSSSQSESEIRSNSEDDGLSEDDEMFDSDDDRSTRGPQGPTFEDIKEITIRRSKLAKWFMEPFFEELIVGCFVRVGIGKSRSGAIYRLCMVRNVDATDPNRQYKLENKTTHKYLNVVWGNENTAARWQMAMISDSPPLEEEFRQLLREVERHGGRMPTKQDVLEKKEALQKAKTFVYSAATVKQMLQEKESTLARPLNVAAEKERLRRQLEIAQSKHDETEVERIKTRLQQLEASRQAQEKDKKAIRLAEMNRKNRVENFKNASELKPVNTLLKAGEAGYDPFSRRWTRSRNYYDAKPPGGELAVGNGDSNGALPGGNINGARTEAGIAATEAALEAAAGAGKLVDTSAPVDQGTESNMLHDFEVPITLNTLQKFGGPQGALAGFMARKQRIEATIGYCVPENDGRRHALTLTVGDYKRRRGLL
ncbi:hypothetical protein SLA2020_468500 [Shorea laevis]